MIGRILCVALFLIAQSFVDGAGQCPTQGYPKGKDTVVNISRPEGTRYFHVYVPSSYNNAAAVPLVFTFHGLNDNCDNFIDATGFKPYADSQGFVLVAPCGSVGSLGVAWNSGTCCGFSDDTHPDDVAFTRAMVQTVSQELCIDSSKIYVSGFSNGAFMSEILACRAADVFRAAASISGVVEMRPGNSEGLDACDQSFAAAGRSLGVLNVHGNMDFVVPWTGDAILGFPTIPDDMDRWAKRAHCTSGPTQTFTKGSFSNQVWSGCGNSVVELVKNDGGSHEWPETSDFDTTAYIVDFFLKRNP